MWVPEQPSTVPAGMAALSTNVAIRRFAEKPTRSRARRSFQRGGHFAALQAPGTLANDVRAFCHTVR
jgi:hypothetical protein